MASVFLSHSSDDNQLVAGIAADLLVEGGVVTWLDEAEMRPGDSISGMIADGIERADFVAVFLSPASVRSTWVAEELRMAAAIEQVRGEVMLVPALAGDLPDADVPREVRDRCYVDFRAASSYRGALVKLLERVAPGRGHRGPEPRSALRTEVLDDLKLVRLARELVQGDEHSRRAAAMEAYDRGAAALERVLADRSVAEPSGATRQWINRALGKLDSPGALETLRRNKEDGDQFAAQGAIDALAERAAREPSGG